MVEKRATLVKSLFIVDSGEITVYRKYLPRIEYISTYSPQAFLVRR